MHGPEVTRPGHGSRHLALLLALLLLPATARPESIEEQRMRLGFDRAVTAGDWKAAADFARRIAALAPDDPVRHFNLACALARQGEADAALAALEEAAARGFRFTDNLLRDHDLDPVRGHPRFAAVLEKVRANDARSRQGFKKRAERAVVVEVTPQEKRAPGPMPLVIALHGRGGDAASFAGAWHKAAAALGALLILPQGMTRRGGGFEWGTVEEGEYLVLRCIEAARKRHRIDPERIVVAGFSQGAELSLRVALRHPGRFAGAISVAGTYDPEMTPLPEGTLPRVYLLNGELDREAENNRRAARLLESAGAAVALRIVPGIGHAFPPDRDLALEQALRFALGMPPRVP